MGHGSMRGEVRFSAGGADHVLRYTTNRICAMEAGTGRRIQDMAGAVGDDASFSVSVLRTLLAYGLDVSESVAGDLMDDLGLDLAGQLVGRALSLAFAGVDPVAQDGVPAGKLAAAAK